MRPSVPTWRLGAAIALALAAIPAGAGTGPEYRNQASALTAGGGSRGSANFSMRDDAVGQPAAGDAAGLAYGIRSGFVNPQVVDVSPPPAPAVADGLGVDVDISETAGEVCANWSGALDPESGIFDHVVAVGTAPGLDDVVAAAFVGAATSWCLSAEVPLCRPLFVTVQARNGAGLLSAPGASDGFQIIRPFDTDGDGAPNDCDPDDDDDGVPDAADPCPCDAADDADADGFCDNDAVCGLDVDLCPTLFNPSQRDRNGDGVGDACSQRCTFYVDVDPLAVPDCTTIEACIAVAPAGCVVDLAAGLYPERPEIDRPLSLVGAGPGESTIVAGPGGGPTIRVTGQAKDGATIEGLTVSGGDQGIRLDGAARVRDVQVIGADTGVFVGPGDGVAVMLERLDVDGGRVGVDVVSGDVELHRSRVHDSSERGIRVRDAAFLAVNTLVTGHALEGVAVEDAADVTLRFSTVASSGVGIAAGQQAGATTVSDSIVASNARADLVDVPCVGVARTNLSGTGGPCCGIQGNLCSAPQFEDPAGGDYRLTLDAPAVDAGLSTTAVAGAPCLDNAGSPRVLDGDADGVPLADLGALEFVRPSVVLEPLDVVFVDRETLDWSDAMVADYAVYRGPLSSLALGASPACLATTTVSELSVAGEPILPGVGLYYLVSARVAAGEGSLGVGTCAERPNATACP